MRRLFVSKVLFGGGLALLGGSLFGVDPEVRKIKTVYLLRMSSALDQFLASELTKSEIYTVTTDPQQADAVFTESLGEAFERKLLELYPPAKAEPAKPAQNTQSGTQPMGLRDDSSQRFGAPRMSAGKGTMFLVDRRSRTLLWSTNRQPKNTSAEEMTEHAQKIVQRLKKDLTVPASAK